MSSVLSEPHAASAWVPAPPLSEAQVEGSFWSFGAAGQPPYAGFMVLAPDGLIGNYRNPNEDGWVLLHGRLAFLSREAVPTTIFDRAEMSGGEITALAGRVRLPGQSLVHILRRVSHPPHPLYATPADEERSAVFLKRPSRPPRPHLVVLRAGEGSLHPDWARTIAEDERSWDLCISYYGADPAAVLADADYVTHQPRQRKFQALHDCFFPDSPLWDYQRIWLPDDDLKVSWLEINQLFHIARKHGLDLAQPSLRQVAGCYITHGVTAQQAGLVLRYVDFVEIMCPVFSGRALRICLGTFRDSVSGFGLDHLWPALLGNPRARLAVMDAVGIVHTRPIGSSYDVGAALAEERALLNAYELRPVQQEPLMVRLRPPAG